MFIIILFVLAIVLYVVAVRNKKEPLILTAKTNLADRRQVVQFTESSQRLLKKVNIVVWIIPALAILVPVGMIAYTYILKGAVAVTNSWDAIMNAFSIYALAFSVTLFIVFMFRVVLFSMFSEFLRIVEQLHQQDFDQLLHEHQMLGFFDKILHPMVVDSDVLYVFKVGQVLEIKIPNITKIKIERQIRGGGLIVRIWEGQKHSLFLVYKRRYCETVLRRVQVFLRNGVYINR